MKGTRQMGMVIIVIVVLHRKWGLDRFEGQEKSQGAVRRG